MSVNRPVNRTLCEYETVEYDELGISIDHPFITALDLLNQQVVSEIVQIQRTAIKATQYVGVIHTTYGSLTILPKVDSLIETEKQATLNLIRLLEYAYDLPLLSQADANLMTGRGNWFELLILIFARKLYEQFQQGLERTYITVEESQPTLKGRWLMMQQLTKHPATHHIFDVQYDEFLADTPLNRVFRYVIDVLLGLSRSSQNRRLLSDMKSMLDQVTVVHRMTKSDLDKIIFTRLNDRFYATFQLARLLIESMTQVMQTGKTPLSAFVFDMNELFERFVAQFLIKHWQQIVSKPYRSIQVKAQMRDEKQIYLAKGSDGRNAFQLIPDLVLRNPLHEIVLIVDTKYKQLKTKNPNLGVSQADMYQMLAYSQRLGCPHVLLLYPSNLGEVLNHSFSMFDSDIKIDVRTLNIHQPLHHLEILIHEFQSIFIPYLSS